MTQYNDPAAVKAQYATPDALDARIRLHQRYSVNSQAFGDWLFEQYGPLDGLNVLELGCGSAASWKERLPAVARIQSLTLSDLMQGMVDEARRVFESATGNVSHRVIDAQAIPFDDQSLDLVIANMMLYHVPDIGKALGEIRRVLRPGGRLCCATYGENGLLDWLAETLRPWAGNYSPNRSFTLQNGGTQLAPCFTTVERRDRADALRVTDVGDLVAYARSSADMLGVAATDDEMRAAFEARRKDGVIDIPKEYGMFIATR